MRSYLLRSTLQNRHQKVINRVTIRLCGGPWSLCRGSWH